MRPCSAVLSDYDYLLADDRIAQHPADKRDDSLLLALMGRRTEHLRFRDIASLLAPGDLLVINDTKVIPARLFAFKTTGARIEVLLLEERGPELWLALVRPGRKVLPGDAIAFDGAAAKVEAVTEDGERLLRFDGDVRELMGRCGELPLPPYIAARAAEPGRYQTVYARSEGAVAAPTAGLHFTPELLDEIRDTGVNVAALTLHVGPGTFRPVKVEDISRHQMHAERFEIPERTAALVARTKAAGRRVIAVGTTVTRALEAAAIERIDGIERTGVTAVTGVTDIFIRPGFRFQVVDGLITNFHLPRSTLLMLVAAFADHAGLGGLARIRSAYEVAIALDYRFFSFGDAMLLLGENPS